MKITQSSEEKMKKEKHGKERKNKVIVRKKEIIFLLTFASNGSIGSR
jgi:hypothetical protein